jgi:hypothetical protein
MLLPAPVEHVMAQDQQVGRSGFRIARLKPPQQYRYGGCKGQI